MDTERLFEKYKSDLATNYDEERVCRPKWIEEERVIEEILSNLPTGSKIIDIPVGTGRFSHLYKKYGVDVVGVDVSDDMLSIANEKAKNLDLKCTLALGDIRHLSWPDQTFDASVCIRMFQWFSAKNVAASLKELSRVSSTVIFGAPTYMPFVNIRTVKDFKFYLLQWKLRFYKWRTSSELHVHQVDVISSAISESGLQLTEKFPIYSKKHEYAIYVAKPLAK